MLHFSMFNSSDTKLTITKPYISFRSWNKYMSERKKVSFFHLFIFLFIIKGLLTCRVKITFCPLHNEKLLGTGPVRRLMCLRESLKEVGPSTPCNVDTTSWPHRMEALRVHQFLSFPLFSRTSSGRKHKLVTVIVKN